MVGAMRRARDGRKAGNRPNHGRPANGILDTSDRQRPLTYRAERLVVQGMQARSIRLDMRDGRALGALGNRGDDEAELHRRQNERDDLPESREGTGHVHGTR